MANHLRVVCFVLLNTLFMLSCSLAQMDEKQPNKMPAPGVPVLQGQPNKDNRLLKLPNQPAARQSNLAGQNNPADNPALGMARNRLKEGMRNIGAAVQMSHAASTIKLADNPDCKADVELLCAKTMRNNFQILDCLQNDKQSSKTVSLKCQHVIWSYKQNLTKDMRFDSAASQVCKDDLDKLSECSSQPPGTGKRISCLIEHKENITRPSCRQFLTKMASIVFGDYRLICNFADECHEDIQNLKCGRFDAKDDEGHDKIHNQGEVIECLSSKVRKLSESCKHEILRIAELQSDDFHEDRSLFYSCRDDRERLCGKVSAGNGKVYKCLFKHKFDKSMSTACRSQLTRRQSLMQADVKVNRGLMQHCRPAIHKFKCLQQEGAPKGKHARQAIILTCLEGAIRDGKDNNNAIEPECVAELKETRRSLMQDYMINPELVIACDLEIKKKCGGGIEREGKTMHCLMDVARKDTKKLKEGEKPEMSTQCKRTLEDVIDRADPGESLSMDPALQAACGTVATSLCGNKKDESGNVISCLLEKIGDDVMTDDCEEKLLEIQFFIARDFRLDPRLYKFCKADATSLCSASSTWQQEDTDTTPERGPHTFACLYRHYKLKSTDETANIQLSRACAFEVRRVMRQRAVSVELNPRIQDPCLSDLGDFCKDRVKKGEEIQCLQKHFKDLTSSCQKAIGNFTQDQDKDVRMDKIIMKKCTPMIKKFCSELLDDRSTEPGEVMDCLIEHKTKGDMDPKCRAGIEHHQLISLEDYRFSYKFKEACKQDVLKLCKEGVKTKAAVVKCLSETVRNDTLKERPQRVSVLCRSQLTFQLLQRSESIKLDPNLERNCGSDIEQHCSNVSPGSGAILECLKKNEKKLLESCKNLVFKRQEVESVNVRGDFFLFKQCKRMIKTYCPEAKPGQVFKCLREHKDAEDFDKQCKKAMLERMREKARDVRLNVNLMTSCKADINKFCEKEMTNLKVGGIKLEGMVIGCLRIQFARKRLTETCTDLMSTKVRQSSLDYKQDPELARNCHTEISKFCTDNVVAQDLDDHGQVEQCLKKQMIQGNIQNADCIKSIARVLAENKADVHSDPVLYRACAVDINHYCQGVPRGEGRQMSCLLAGLDDKTAHLTKTCTDMLTERRQMWENAAEQAPVDDLSDVVHQIVISPSRNYLMSFIFLLVGFIFFGGLCCGRVTKRVRRELKDR